MQADESGKLGSDHAKPVGVPVFNCIVCLTRDPDIGVRARVANLAGLECTAGNEREALARLIPAFKARVAELTRNNSPIAWVDPLPPAEPGEVKRFVPVHL